MKLILSFYLLTTKGFLYVLKGFTYWVFLSKGFLYSFFTKEGNIDNIGSNIVNFMLYGAMAGAAAGLYYGIRRVVKKHMGKN